MTRVLIEGLLAYQSASGAFRATVETAPGIRHPDETSMITAQVCLFLLRPGLASASAPLRHALDAGLSFIERCASPCEDGWFHLHPPREAAPPPDLQATALCWLALLQASRCTPQTARAALAGVIRSTAITAPGPDDPAWVTPGLCRSERGPAGAVDLVTNIHLAACRALTGLRLEPAAAAAITRASAGHTRAGRSLNEVSPFTPDAAEIELALEQAVRAGQTALLPALKAARRDGHGRQDRLARRPAERPLRCDPGGWPVWRAPPLQLARWLYDLSYGERPAPRPLQPCL
ncbi:hypothetical protein [Alloyangia pacifica]|uniref:Prenyltransferase n=1 Tax=Alloyangia pacifica TaxID=311180 RepID=A0A1I6T2P3_9RHOB|nr:hypothetical protein [Alloyangia pacifica]SDG95154.1 hypothetical protein SAMN04488245_105238 [Alloyangia pacifica]SFS83393.1 hypothetical protein SAMN04488050_105238 [Alloyangia pacifica]